MQQSHGKTSENSITDGSTANPHKNEVKEVAIHLSHGDTCTNQGSS